MNLKYKNLIIIIKMSINCIFAVDNNFGISKNGKTPWNIKNDMEIFKKITENNTVIMGKNTYLSIPKKYRPLKNRNNIVISTTLNKKYYDDEEFILTDSLNNAIDVAHDMFNDVPLFICGGSKLYNECLKRKDLNKIHMTKIYEDYQTDNFIDKKFLYRNLTILNSKIYPEFEYIEYKVNHNEEEQQYLKLLENLISQDLRKTRNGNTLSDFGHNLEFDLTDKFPILTSKKVFWRGIVEELLFFIRGDTDSKKLSDKKIKIWDGNTTREFLDKRGLFNYNVGDMGPMYGWNWRHFGAEYINKETDYSNKGFDQLIDVIKKLIDEPTSRRIFMTAFDPSKVNEAVLPPCHSMVIQFYVKDGYINEYMYQRSSDSFLGLPFNITQHALLLSLIGYVTGLKPKKLIISLGDVHIYEDHIDVVKKQLNRCTYEFPKLKINKELPNTNMSIKDRVKFLEDLEFSDIKLINYISNGLIRANMIV